MAIDADTRAHTPVEDSFHGDFEKDTAATERYFDSARFDGITRLYSARQVVEQRGTIPSDYIVAREAAEAFYPRLRELFAQKSITTFGPYSPGQAVAMKRRHRRDLSRGLGDVGQGLEQRGPGARPRELPAQPGARRGRRPGPCAADRGSQPAVPGCA